MQLTAKQRKEREKLVDKEEKGSMPSSKISHKKNRM